ncbi:MAG: B12-binding domain-containing radical SAM protein [Thermoplasmata archaeon]|nr:MAG: B12-binding domain-containing radical SAM protein [Thermoplasmata archaeon]
MKITLISPSPPDLYAPGVRTLSSYLKKNRHQTKLILLAGGTENLRFGGQFVYQYRDYVIDQVIELSKDTDIVGISFMTQYFDRALQLTKRLKETIKVPIVWGGIHPTLCPEEGVIHADMVCIGEGEEALLELMDKMEKGQDPYNTKNFWFRRNGGGDIIRNEIRPPITDLDTLPFQDYDFNEHYVYDPIKDSIVALTGRMFENLFSLAPALDGRMKPSYKIMTTRGCPMNCTFCASSVLKKKFYSHRYVRHRSVGNVIKELEEITTRFPSIKIIQFFDDILFSLKKDYIKDLCTVYEEKIGLPFYCQASATTLDEEKLRYLLDAGLIWVEIGIQSGSDRTNQLYSRKVSNTQVLKAANLLHKYNHRMLSPCYHVISDNPWETKEDILKTLSLITDLPRPYWIKLSSLVLFPKTDLYEKAKAEGLIKNDLEEIYRKPFLHFSGNYLNYLIYLSGYCYFPRWILKVLKTPFLVRIFQQKGFDPLFTWLYQIAEVVRKGGRAMRALLHGDFKRVFHRVQFLLRAKRTG